MKKILLTVASLALLTGVSQADLTDGLINYWNFDNNLNDTGPAGATVDNGTFDGANGTDGISYGPGLFGVAGIEQNGAGGGSAGQENDGAVRIIRSTDTLMGANGSTVSISVWVQAAGFDTGWQTILAHGEGSQYRIHRRSGDTPGVAAYAGGSGNIPSAGVGPVIAAGTGWHHIVAISEGGVSTRLWVDGGLVAIGAPPTIDDSGNNNTFNPDLFIGGNPQTGANNREWWGEIDDVGMWDRVITDAEVREIYNNGLAGHALVQVAPVVINTADSGPGSLRRAIIDAPSGETITFADTLDGKTITLDGQLLINKNITIDAANLPGGITIDGDAKGRIFQVSGSSTVTFDSLTLTNGLADWGGAIYVYSGTLTLNNSTLSGNAANGFYGGGAIDNAGTLTLNNSTLSGNAADSGGGGGIYNEPGATLTLNNSTLSGNSSDFGGGGIYNEPGGTLNGNNSIVAGNTSSSGDPNTSESIPGSNNLTSGDPLLAPLGDYGGPTQTMPPLPGSPALDSGVATDNTPATDQRGLPRIVGAGLDIGAYETGNAAGYAAWATETLPPGGNLSFDADADGDGIINGFAYGIGPDGFPETTLTPDGTEVSFGYRPEAELDLIWTLQRTTDLKTYEQILRIESGVVTIPPNVTLSGTPPDYVLLDENALPSVFYRLGVELAEPQP